jgi:hypothetical protein
MSEIIEKEFTVPNMRLSEFHFPGNPIVPGMWTLKKITELIGIEDCSKVTEFRIKGMLEFGKSYKLQYSKHTSEPCKKVGLVCSTYSATVYSLDDKVLCTVKGIKASSSIELSAQKKTSRVFVKSPHIPHAQQMLTVDYNGYLHFHNSLCDYKEDSQVDSYLELDSLAQVAIDRFSRLNRFDIKLNEPPVVLLVSMSNIVIKKHLRYGCLYDSRCNVISSNENKLSRMMAAKISVFDMDSEEILIEADIKGAIDLR